MGSAFFIVLSLNYEAIIVGRDIQIGAAFEL